MEYLVVDISNEALKQEIELTTGLPDWRSVTQGLNIEFRCGNEQCEAFNQYVVHKHGMQDFDLMQDKAECPMCKTAGQAATCAFLGCAYSFSGQKRAHSAGQWESVRGDWTVCAANTYTRFNETCDDSMVEWRRLMICVRPTPDGQSLDLVSSSKIGPPQPCEGVKSSEGDVVQPYTRLCGQMDLLMLVDLDCACAICLEDMRPDTTASPVQALPCGHSFHGQCIQSWSCMSLTCPTCRAAMAPAPESRNVRRRIGA